MTADEYKQTYLRGMRAAAEIIKSIPVGTSTCKKACALTFEKAILDKATEIENGNNPL